MSHPSRPTLTVFRRTACELCDDAELLLQAVLEERVVRGDLIPQVRRVVIDGDPDLEARFGGIVPVPGGLGVIEAGLIGGMTAAGVPETTAMAATFTSRLFTAYLPPVWGWFALHWLRQHDYV